MNSLNGIIKGLSDIATAHKQIRTFSYSDINSFLTSGTTEYVAMLVEKQPARKTRSFTAFKFTIYVFDKVFKDESNEQEVQSDLIRICEDLIAEIKHPSWTWYAQIAQDIQIDYDTERTLDWLTGAWFTIEFRVMNPDNRCQIPEDSITRF